MSKNGIGEGSLSLHHRADLFSEEKHFSPKRQCAKQILQVSCFCDSHSHHTSFHTSSLPTHTHRQLMAIVVHEKGALEDRHAGVHNVVEE